jgi:hypothetical protein
MIGVEDLRLNGINEPGVAHTWVTGEDWDVLDRDIKKLHRKYNYTQIATKLHVPHDLVKRRVRRLIKWGELRAKVKHKHRSDSKNGASP